MMTVLIISVMVLAVLVIASGIVCAMFPENPKSVKAVQIIAPLAIGTMLLLLVMIIALLI